MRKQVAWYKYFLKNSATFYGHVAGTIVDTALERVNRFAKIPACLTGRCTPQRDSNR